VLKVSTSIPPSGEQWTIRSGDLEAVVVEVGGGLRTFTDAGRDVLWGYGEQQECHAGRGQLLMPWPNRIADGRYDRDGKTRQLALSEPARHNAIHGLVRWATWSVIEHGEDHLTVGYRLHPQQGWSWTLDLRVAYRLDAEGLTVRPHARNVGTGDAPFGFGVHPYVTAGEARVDELELTVPAASSLQVDTERLLPVGTQPVDGGPHDWRDGGLLGGAELDTAFTDVIPYADGRWRVRLRHPGTGRAVTVWADAGAYPWLQVFTGDSLPEPLRRTSGVAVEPMTCPPDAFRSGQDLVVLAPGQEFEGDWGISPT
jgi:aldose 1-epimerase